ncbi:MAG TPA: acetoacetate decarboxylase family protein [Polyangiaceae bacterium]|nr:acetoacetate decarboxylase family protein [Polyangiaceae bacterium]
MNDSFFDVERTIHRTSAGLVELPILYYDASNVVALFDADRRGAEQLLVGTSLEPAGPRGDKALVGLSFYEYRRTTVGVYNEVGTAILARKVGTRGLLHPLVEMMLPPSRRAVGAWVVDLPVTTEAANAAGRDLWGYPKFVTEIELELRGKSVRGVVHDPLGGDAICQLSGEMGAGIVSPAMSVVTFTKLDGALVRTHIDVRAPTRMRAAGSIRLDVGTSTHPMAKNLRTLGLDGAKPKALIVTERFQSLLHAGRRVA